MAGGLQDWKSNRKAKEAEDAEQSPENAVHFEDRFEQSNWFDEDD